MIRKTNISKVVAFCILHFAFFIPVKAQAAQKPRLVVNIVVGGMRADYLSRFSANLTSDGFNRFVRGGVVYSNARYEFMTTTPPATLATIASGANPSIHGIVGRHWYDMVSGNAVDLIADPSAQGLDTEPNEGGYSYRNQVVSTLGDEMRSEYGAAKVVTISADPMSAVVLGGRRGEVYWLDEGAATWISSSKYMTALPDWVKSYNARGYERVGQYTRVVWVPTLPIDRYVNTRYGYFKLGNGRFTQLANNGKHYINSKRLSQTMTTPAVSDFTADFVRHAITYSTLGRDDTPDLLNIYFGNLRSLGEEFGGESVELEDAFYRMDRVLAAICNFITAQFGERVLFVLTSDGGLSSSFDAGAEPRDRFNTEQFRVIANSFLTAQYGGNNWVVGSADRKIYINHNLAYRMGLNLDDIRERLTTFAVEFRGVVNALSASAMQNGGFTDPVRRRMQNSYYPNRSGDVMISLAPGWIEVVDGVRAQSGSLYDYDVHVPLMFAGAGLKAETILRNVDMTALAVALSDIMGVNRPEGAMGDTLFELVSKLR